MRWLLRESRSRISASEELDRVSILSLGKAGFPCSLARTLANAGDINVRGAGAIFEMLIIPQSIHSRAHIVVFGLVPSDSSLLRNTPMFGIILIRYWALSTMRWSQIPSGKLSLTWMRLLPEGAINRDRNFTIPPNHSRLGIHAITVGNSTISAVDTDIVLRVVGVTTRNF